MALKFSPTVEAGQIMQAVALIGAVITGYINLRTDLDTHDRRIAIIERLSEERVAADSNWRNQISGSMRDLTIAVSRLNDSLIRIEATSPHNKDGAPVPRP